MKHQPIFAQLKQVWITQAGYGAIVLQVPIGHLCGYVMVPKGNPAYGKLDYLDPPINSIQCHFGINFAEFNNNPEYPYPVEQTEPDAYWIGFSCDHWNDGRDPEAVRKFLSAMDGSVREETVRLLSEGHIWTVEEVAQQCESIAEQLKEMVS